MVGIELIKVKGGAVERGHFVRPINPSPLHKQSPIAPLRSVAAQTPSLRDWDRCRPGGIVSSTTFTSSLPLTSYLPPTHDSLLARD